MKKPLLSLSLLLAVASGCMAKSQHGSLSDHPSPGTDAAATILEPIPIEAQRCAWRGYPGQPPRIGHNAAEVAEILADYPEESRSWQNGVDFSQQKFLLFCFFSDNRIALEVKEQGDVVTYDYVTIPGDIGENYELYSLVYLVDREVAVEPAGGPLPGDGSIPPQEDGPDGPVIIDDPDFSPVRFTPLNIRISGEAQGNFGDAPMMVRGNDDVRRVFAHAPEHWPLLTNIDYGDYKLAYFSWEANVSGTSMSVWQRDSYISYGYHRPEHFLDQPETIHLVYVIPRNEFLHPIR